MFGTSPASAYSPRFSLQAAVFSSHIWARARAALQVRERGADGARSTEAGYLLFVH